MSVTKLSWIAVAAVGLLIGIGVFWLVRANRALEQASISVSHSGIPFEVRTVSDSKPAAVDFLSTPPDFRDAQLFHDSLYVCGAGGIWVYDLAGNLRSTYLVGRDLPPFAPVTMAVGTIAGDAEPKLWIGTTAGILGFDGVRFSEFAFDVKAYGDVTSLLVLPTGILLIGLSEGGVAAYDGTRIRPFHSSLSSIRVTALSGSEGDLWIGTRDRGVIHWRGGSAEEFHDQRGLPDNRVLSVSTTEDRVFVGTPVGVAEFRDGKHVRNIAEGVFSRALLATKDHLLIGTVDDGIFDAPLGGGKVLRFAGNSDLSPHGVRQFMDIQGVAFALTTDRLFEQEVRTGLWTERISAANASWSDRNISALALDGLGKLWIGYFDRGIDIADVEGVQKPIHVEDDQVFCINRIVPDVQRNLQVVATANGLVLFSPQGKILRRIDRSDGLIADHVTDVAVRRTGLAVATAAGITLLDEGGPQSIYAFHGLTNNHVYTLGMNGSQLLAGTLGGLSLIQDGFVRTSYTTANSPLKQNWISAVVPAGGAWFVGTYGGGVLKLEANGEWTDFSDMPPRSVINPNAMLAVSNRIVAGTLDKGLLIYNAADNRWTSLSEGLPSLNVTALAASASRLFIGTDNGVVRMPVERVFR